MPTSSLNGRLRKTFFFLLLAPLAIVALSSSNTGCRSSEYTSLADLLQRHPSNRLENWQGLLTERKGAKGLPDDFIQPAGTLPLQYGIAMNELDGFEPPETAEPEPEKLEVVRKNLGLALRSQPELERFLSLRVAGIYLVRNLGSSGLTGFIYDRNGVARAGFILMDWDRVQMSAEDMINLREKTIIQQGSKLPSYWGYRLTCGNAPCPGSIDGLTYLLFHESAHVASEVYGTLPGLFLSDQEQYEQLKKGMPDFFANYWKDLHTTRTEFHFRKALKFYGNEPYFSREEHARAVKLAFDRGFPGLYSVQDCWEFMAEVTAYSMLNRTLEFHSDADFRFVFSARSQAGLRGFIAELKGKMAQDQGISLD